MSGTGLNSVINKYETDSDNNSPYSSVIGGDNHTINSTTEGYNGIYAGSGNTITNSEYSSIVGGLSNSITNSNNATILGSRRAEITDSNLAFMAASQRADNGVFPYMSNDANASFMIGVFRGSYINGAYRSGIVASNDSYINQGVNMFIAGGNGNQFQNGGEQSVIIGGVSNYASVSVVKDTILNGEQNRITNDARLSGIYNGYNNYINGVGNNNSIYHSENCYLDGANHYYNNIFGSIDSNIKTTNDGSFHHNNIFGSKQSYISGSTNSSIIAGSGQNYIYGSTGSTIMASKGGEIYGATDEAVVIGCEGTAINVANGGSNLFMAANYQANISGGTQDRVVMIGNEQSKILSFYTGIVDYAKFNGMYGSNVSDIYVETGSNNTIVGSRAAYLSATTGSYNTIVGSQTINIKLTTGQYNGFYSSNNSDISSNTNRTIGIGLSGRTLTESNTTYTENHASFGQSYQGYFNNGSGSTFTIDWNKGNTQKMSWNASGGTITCDNTQTGAHYRMIINNPNGHTPSSFTAAGRTIKFNGGSFVVYSGESICELFITDDSVFVNQLGLFS